jgi:hypothetical protein
MNGPRDRHGAIIQPPSSGGTAPYGWFGWEPGYRGEPRVRMFGLKPPRQRRDAQSCSLTPHEDIRVIGVANEPKPSPRQFAIQFVENDVGKQR